MSPTRALTLTCALAAAAITFPLPLLGDIAQGVGLAEGTEGAVIAAIQIGYAVGLVALVPRGDRPEARRLIGAHVAVMSLGLATMAAAPGAVTLLSAALVMGAAATVIQIAVAFAATVARAGEDGRALGTATSGVVIGLIAGRSLGGPVAEVIGWRGLFAATGLVGIGLALALPRALPARAGTGAASPRAAARLYRTEPLLRRRAFLAFCAFAATSAFWATLPLELHGPPHDLAPGAVGAIGLVGLSGAVAARRSGRRTDADRGDAASTAGLALLAAAWLPLALVDHSLAVLVVGAAALDAGLQMIHVANQAALGALEPGARSSIIAAYMLAYSLGSAVGAVTATGLHRSAGWPSVALFGTGASLAALTTWLRWTAHQRDRRAARRARRPATPLVGHRRGPLPRSRLAVSGAGHVARQLQITAPRRSEHGEGWERVDDVAHQESVADDLVP